VPRRGSGYHDSCLSGTLLQRPRMGPIIEDEVWVPSCVLNFIRMMRFLESIDPAGSSSLMRRAESVRSEPDALTSVIPMLVQVRTCGKARKQGHGYSPEYRFPQLGLRRFNANASCPPSVGVRTEVRSSRSRTSDICGCLSDCPLNPS